MPLWHVYHPVGAYSPDDKQAFAADVTALYTSFGLPPFYVVTLFHEVEAASFLVGGTASGASVRIVIEHIARHVSDPDQRRRTAAAIGALITPYTTDRDLSVEYHVDETPRDLWMMNGLFPPPSGSDAEKLWARENRPVPY